MRNLLLWTTSHYALTGWFFSVLIGTSGVADSRAVSASNGNDSETTSNVQGYRLDAWHDRISNAVTMPIERLDRFFGDEQLDDEAQKTRMVAGAGVRIDEREGFAAVTEVKLRLAMPRTENRFQIIFDDAFTVDEPERSRDLLEAARESEPDAGLRFLFSKDEKTALSADVGLRMGSPTQLFGRLRGRLTVPLERWELRVSQTASWFVEEGWTAISEVRVSRPIENKLLFRSVSRLKWSEVKQGVSPSQSLMLFKELSPRSGVNMSIMGSWPEVPNVEEANYTAVLSYRRLIYRTWMFLEIAPGIEFSEKFEYDANPFVTGLIEIVFGG